MIDPRAIITARRYGAVRYSVLTDFSGDMNRVLSKFGLTPDKSGLVAQDRETALSILTLLLYKEMAYNSECMPETDAARMARQLLSDHEHDESQYFSNGNWAEHTEWNPLTESTFDSGLIITGPEHRFFCIWFEDEE